MARPWLAGHQYGVKATGIALLGWRLARRLAKRKCCRRLAGGGASAAQL